MAVVVKNTPEARTGPSPFDRLQVVALAGVVYLLGSLAIVFKVIPMLWAGLWGGVFGFQVDSFTSYTLQAMLMLAGAVGLVVLGGRLLGPKAQPGVKAGIFNALVGLLLVALLTRWYSVWAEHMAFHRELVPIWGGKTGIQGIGDFFHFLFATVLFLPGILGGWTGAMVMTIIVGLVLLFLFLRMFFSKRADGFLVGMEAQGWFSANNYKKNQGNKVRRGTILGILLLFATGVYTMISHNTLAGAGDWKLDVPFTGFTEFRVDDLAKPRIGLQLNEKLKERHQKWFDVEEPAKKLQADIGELVADLSKLQEKLKEKHPDWLKKEGPAETLQATIDDVSKAGEDVEEGLDYQGAREALAVVNGELKTLLQNLADVRVNADWVSGVEAASKKVKEAAAETEKVAREPLRLNRYVLQTDNQEIDPETHVMIYDPLGAPTGFKQFEVLTKTEFEKLKKEAEEQGNRVPRVVAPTPIYGPETFASITLLPSVRFTLPLLLLAFGLWFAWRVVNLPGFADFLIATEGELNKVSWTTRRRLFQDTIVVLVTLILMAGYLFCMDQVWGYVLSRKYIGVIVFQQDTNLQTNKGTDKPW